MAINVEGIKIVKQFKQDWKDTFRQASVSRQDWIINQLIAQLKEVDDKERVNHFVMISNSEFADWIES